MRLSRAKTNQLSRLMLGVFETHPGVRLLRDTNTLRLALVKIIEEELRRDEFIDRRVRQKIASQRQDIPEGGREWELLYRQYYRQEFDRHRLSR